MNTFLKTAVANNGLKGYCPGDSAGLYPLVWRNKVILDLLRDMVLQRGRFDIELDLNAFRSQNGLHYLSQADDKEDDATTIPIDDNDGAAMTESSVVVMLEQDL